MRPDEVLARYDAEMRRDPVGEPGTRVERVDPVVRIVGAESYVIFSALSETNAREVVEREAEFFRTAGLGVEWKAYGHDRPASLEAILAAAGFVPDEPEVLVALDLEDEVPRGPELAGVEFRRVTDRAGLRDAEAANRAAFGTADPNFLERWDGRLADPTAVWVVAYADAVPVAAGRLEMTPGRSFAGLWGGGTAPAHRHRGIYRGLVGVRAELARAAGYRFLTVDARASSQPILERLGFVPLTRTRAWVLAATTRR